MKWLVQNVGRSFLSRLHNHVSAAAALFVAVDWLEPNYRLARVLKLLILVAAAAAIINRLLL
jgi:hypothetical protein